MRQRLMRAQRACLLPLLPGRSTAALAVPPEFRRTVAVLIPPLHSRATAKRFSSLTVFAVGGRPFDIEKRGAIRLDRRRGNRSCLSGLPASLGLPINPPAHFKRPFLGANLMHPI